MITETQYNQLIKYEHDMSNCLYASTLRITHTDFCHMLEIYYGPSYRKMVSPSVFSCGTCKMGAVNVIAREYFYYKNNIDKDGKEIS